MKKLYAFLLCSIIGCTTSSLWSMDREELKLKDISGCRNIDEFGLRVAQNQQEIMLAQLEAAKEHAAALRDEINVIKEQTAAIQAQTATQQRMIRLFQKLIEDKQ